MVVINWIIGIWRSDCLVMIVVWWYNIIDWVLCFWFKFYKGNGEICVIWYFMVEWYYCNNMIGVGICWYYMMLLVYFIFIIVIYGIIVF